MSDELKPIAVDALGGDYAPEQVVEGALASEVPVILVGPEDTLVPLVKSTGDGSLVQIVHAPHAVAMDESPIQAVRSRKNSSMMTAIRLVKEGRAGGVMSAGNTGAFGLGATTILGRLPEVSRTAAAITVPTPAGQSLLLDAGASTDCTAVDLVNFAVMGSAYAEIILGIPNPAVALLSIGEEETKGSKQSKLAHQMLKKSDLNFIGNVQGSDLGTSVADVVVSDGFTGNVALKAAEGMATLIMEIVRDEINKSSGFEKLAAHVLRPVLRRIKKRLDWQEYGGGALLGVSGNVVIAHGKSRKRAIESAIKIGAKLARTDLLSTIEKSLKAHHDLTKELKDESNG
ncbi:MAG TPA: phosphate acyltransferase PlsX [Firmicutes bacterium]|nr:phosphate acyltransferase PlsX [Bacillota bacterium]